MILTVFAETVNHRRQSGLREYFLVQLSHGRPIPNHPYYQRSGYKCRSFEVIN